MVGTPPCISQVSAKPLMPPGCPWANTLCLISMYAFIKTKRLERHQGQKQIDNAQCTEPRKSNCQRWHPLHPHLPHILPPIPTPSWASPSGPHRPQGSPATGDPSSLCSRHRSQPHLHLQFLLTHLGTWGPWTPLMRSTACSSLLVYTPFMWHHNCMFVHLSSSVNCKLVRGWNFSCPSVLLAYVIQGLVHERHPIDAKRQMNVCMKVKTEC